MLDQPQMPAFDQLGSALRETARRRQTTARVRVALVVLLALVLTAGAMTLTEPGRAVAHWIGELVGLSDDSKPETIDQRLSNAIAIGDSTAPGGEPYTVYADRDTDEGLCFDLTWTEGKLRGFGTCQKTGVGSDLSVPFISNEIPDAITVAGLVPAEATNVRVTYKRAPDAATQEALSALFELDAQQRQALQVEPGQDYGLFVAFLPEGVGEIDTPSSAEVAALDASGAVIARSPISWATTTIDDPLLSVVSCTDGNAATLRFCR